MIYAYFSARFDSITDEDAQKVMQFDGKFIADIRRPNAAMQKHDIHHSTISFRCKDCPVQDLILLMCRFIEAVKPTLIEFGGYYLRFTINWEGIQGGMEFSKEQLRALARLDMGIAMNYAYVKPDN